MKKRIISALLAVCLLVSLGTVGVFAAEPVDGETETETNYVAQIGNEQYESLEAAVNAVTGTEATTIKLLSDCSGGGIIVPEGKNIVFDFGGHTYTISGEAVGSAGTESNGFQLLKDSTIVMQNGEIIANHNTVQIVIQNYSNLTLNNMTIDANKGSNNVSYVMSNNCGNVHITGNTSLTAKANGVAFDVCDYADYTGVTVTVDTTGTITGKVEVSNPNGNDSNEQLVIKSGNFVGSFDIQDTNQPVEITGGSFKNTDGTANKDVAEYFPPDQALTVDDNGNVVSDPTRNVASVNGVPYKGLAEALAAAEDGDIVDLNSNITVDLSTFGDTQAPYRISKDIKLDGNNHTITATGNTGSNRVHVILVEGNGTDAEITDLNVNGGKVARYGIQAVGNVELELNDVDVRNCTAYGVFANRGASVVANELSTRDNGWGGVNVDTNGGNSKFVMNSGTLAEEYSVVIENSTGASATTTTTLNNGTFNKIQVKTGSGETNNLTINGGRYTDIVGDTESSDGPVKSQTNVTAGTFDNPVDDVAQTPNYRVDRTNGTHNYYNTIEQAMNNANPGDDIEYLGSSRTYEVEFVYSKSYSSTVEVIEDDYIELPGGKYDGKVITGWTRGSVTYDVGDDVRVDRNMTFYVVLKDGEFDITIDSKIEHGDISTNVNSADKGDTVYIYVDPDTGYVLDDIDVYYGLNYRYSVKVSYVRNNTYRFEMPNADVYITATFKANGMPFVDVHRTQWFYDSIYYVWSNDMMEGDSATTFNPDGTMTRAMFWAVLGRMDGQTITGTNWVEQARNWAMREGVSDGTNPNDYVTREQMVTMLWRYAGEKNGSANLNRYTDSGSVSGYAVEAMRWAIGNGVIQGVTSTTLAPKANATRAECATIFMRFDKM